MALALGLMVIGALLLILGLLLWPALSIFSSQRADRTAQLAATIGGGFLAFIGLILAITSTR